MRNKTNIKFEDIILVLMGVFIPLQGYIHIFSNIDVSIAVLLGYFFVLINVKKIVNIVTFKEILSNKGFLFYVLLCLLFLFSIRPGAGFKDGIKINAYLWLGPLLYLALSHKKNTFKYLILPMILFSIPLIIITIMQGFSLQFKIHMFSLPIMKYFVEPNTLKDALISNKFHTGRGTAFFVNPNRAALYFNLLIGFLLFLIFSKSKKWIYILTVTFIFILIFTVRITYSLSGSIALISIILIAFAYAIANKKGNIILLLGILIFAIIVSLPLSINKGEKKLADKGENYRKVTWSVSLSTYKDHFLWGYGFSNNKWDINYLKHAKRYNLHEVRSSHNIFIIIGRYVGIFGIIFQFLFFIFYFFKFKDLFKSKYIVLTLMLITIFFIHSNVGGSNPILNTRIGMMFWIFLSLEQNDD